MTYLICECCGTEGPQVRMTIAQLEADPEPRRWKAIARCVDHDACRYRTMQSGEEWPIHQEDTP